MRYGHYSVPKIGIVHHSVKQNNCKIAWCVLSFESNCNTSHIFISQRAECWKIAQRRSTVILTTSCIDSIILVGFILLENDS